MVLHADTGRECERGLMANKLKAFLDGSFSERNLVIVTNREPYIHKKTTSGIKVESSAGGVTTALNDVLKVIGGVWVAWGSGSGDKDVVDTNDTIQVPPEEPSYTLKRIWLTDSQVDNYYHGYSNSFLWPLCHIALERVYFRESFWKDYQKVNQLFADAVIDIVNEDSIVWVHDYHLCLLPNIIRKKKQHLTIAHFWHIPWPDWSVFRISPQAKELIIGLLGSDLIGFQIPLFVKNFLDCVTESIPSADVDYLHSVVKYNGHTTELKAFPISIDFEKFHNIASDKKTEKLITDLKKKYNLEDKYIGVGVDRLEYTKALLKRLQAIDLFFKKYKGMKGKFTFLQVSVPTRMKEPYLSYKKAVEELIIRINKKYSTFNWQPIVYLDKKLSIYELVAFYRMADVGIISSIYDGMNLVAKEYVASQIDKKGVLILSELAGAADELDGAILINPYDIESFAKNLYMALRIATEEKIERMEMLRNHIKEHNIYRWIADILKEIMIISSIKNKKCLYLYDHLETFFNKIKDKNIFLFLDYDGTLTPIVSSPEKAILSDKMRSLIKKISNIILVAIISGRSIEDIKHKVAIDKILYAGNHGTEIWDGEQLIINHDIDTTKPLLNDLISRLKEMLSSIKGVFIEDKGATVSIHFRQVDIKELGKLFKLFNEVAKEFQDVFKITTGKKVFEIRPVSAWNKGDAVIWLLERYGQGRIPIYIGDDVTDEDAFHAVEGKGISIGVGLNCNADYYLKEQPEVEKFLKDLYKLKYIATCELGY